MGFVGTKAVANTKIHPITIDLNEFKLHIALKDRKELTLHFNSPSRKFYLTVIAFVVNEMKKLGKITSIPVETHYDLLALLNNTIGETAGSSNKEHLLPRIYRKWKDILPNLEEAPLFKVLGKKKEYEEGDAKTYHFTEADKDNWANLFEYKGSEGNVRLKFAVDRIGAGLDDVVIIYEDAINGEAWEKFTSILRDKLEVKPEKEEIEEVHKEPEIQVSQPAKIAWSRRYRWAVLIVVIGVVAGVAAMAIWGLHIRYAPRPEVTPEGKIVSLQHGKPSPVVPPPTEVPAKEKLIAEVPSKGKEVPFSPEKVSRTVTPARLQLEVASKEKMALPLSGKPSIAVLPFVNMSKDPEQEFFSDGLTEEIITTLSKSPHLFVAARTSTSAYKGKSVRVDQVAQDLGIRYVLEGSVRRSGDQVRISAKLIDAKTGHNQWAERYDGKMRDVFTIQDEIASKIMKTLQVKLGMGPDSSEARGGSKNTEAYLKSVEATDQIIRFTKDGITRARRLFEEVIALEPDFSRGYSGLALSYGMNVYFGESASPKESMAQAMDLAQKAISLNETDAINHAALAYLFAITRRHDTAVARAERALALDGNSFPVVDFSGIALMYSCKGKEAVAAFEKAERLNPSFPHSPLHLSWAYRLAGRYEEAFKQAQKAVDRTPQSLLAHLALTATCNLTGREAEARAAAEEVRNISPNFSVERFRNDLYLLFKDQDQVDVTINALRKAGLR
jgi:TolB-like protein